MILEICGSRVTPDALISMEESCELKSETQFREPAGVWGREFCWDVYFRKEPLGEGRTLDVETEGILNLKLLFLFL